MTQEQKNDLSLKDLCARLPYKVKVQIKNIREICTLEEIDCSDNEMSIAVKHENGELAGYDFNLAKPYLFPLSSMTDKQRLEYESLCTKVTSECGDLTGFFFTKDYYYDTVESIDYLYKNHFDIHNLIPMGLANDATGKNIY